jgi:Dullard-like phosphatase family protein
MWYSFFYNMLRTRKKRTNKNRKYSIELDTIQNQRIIGSPVSKTIMPHTNKTGKLTVVLDMDETLLHSVVMVPGTDYTSCLFDVILMTTDKQNRIGVYVRPMLHEFLRYGAEHFEMILFTASCSTYAKPVMDAIDPHGYIKYRFYRDSCLDVNGIITKPIHNLGRRMERIVLVDNSELCMLSCPDNGILISDFTGDPSDDSINQLARFLSHINSLEDVRPFLTETFGMRERLLNIDKRTSGHL